MGTKVLSIKFVIVLGGNASFTRPKLCAPCQENELNGKAGSSSYSSV